MSEMADRRSVARLIVPWRLNGRVCESREVRILDLSVAGARIAHVDLLKPGLPCTLELPAPFAMVQLSARVVWSLFGGGEPTRESDEQLNYQSGLAFTGLTREQQTALSAALETLESASATPSREAFT
jgi:hypothetical protein